MTEKYIEDVAKNSTTNNETFSEKEQRLLSKYVSNTNDSIFVIKNLPEEVIAVLFAYYSRSKEPLRNNLLKLLNDKELAFVDSYNNTENEYKTDINDNLIYAEEKAKSFHEKWVIGYGHASVAEHAVVHLAVENISILASKVIEDSRLASYTEKSTRYVEFDESSLFQPKAIMASAHKILYTNTVNLLFSTYKNLMKPLSEKIAELYPPKQDQKKNAYIAACNAKACDILRYLLPAATLTNIGITINARSLAHLLGKMLSHPLLEIRSAGDSIKKESAVIIPTLLKYATPNEYRASVHDAMDAFSDYHFRESEPINNNSVVLVHYDKSPLPRLISAILYPYTRISLKQMEEEISKWPKERLEHVLSLAMESRGNYDSPIRELENITYTFDILLDYGAYRDIQRHRMCTQSTQILTVEHGYEIPEELELLDMAEQFEFAMDKASLCYKKMVGSLPYEASYIVPLAFRKRVMFTLNLREVISFIELRSSIQGHISYRRIAQKMFHCIKKVHPVIATYIRVNLTDVALARLSSEEKLEEKIERKSTHK